MFEIYDTVEYTGVVFRKRLKGKEGVIVGWDTSDEETVYEVQFHDEHGGDWDIWILNEGSLKLIEQAEPKYHTGGLINLNSDQQWPPSALLEAKQLVGGDRNKDYGHPLDDFGKSAEMWGHILGVDITPEQVALCMIAVKMSRLMNDINKRDSWVDIAGYVECWQRIQNRRVGLE